MCSIRYSIQDMGLSTVIPIFDSYPVSAVSPLRGFQTYFLLFIYSMSQFALDHTILTLFTLCSFCYNFMDFRCIKIN